MSRGSRSVDIRAVVLRQEIRFSSGGSAPALKNAEGTVLNGWPGENRNEKKKRCEVVWQYGMFTTRLGFLDT